MSKSWREVSNDGVNWARLPEGMERVWPFPYRFTRLIEEEDLGAYAGPGGLRRALGALQSGIRVSDSELANALRDATPEEEAWFSAELRKDMPPARSKIPGPGDKFDLIGALKRAPKDPEVQAALQSGRATISVTRIETAAPECPPPWRWVATFMRAGGVRISEDWCLEDARGGRVISADDDSVLAPPSPRVRALTEAAPQLEDVLVRLVARYDDDPEANGYQDLIDEARALLKQIEERSRG